MRMRFSLRVLFIVVTLLAVALYFFVVRPTTLAQKYVEAVARHDYDTAKKMMIGDFPWSRIVEQSNLPDPDHIYAEIMPREWQDAWRGRRRVILRVARHNDYRGGHVEWTEDTDLVSNARGVQAIPAGKVNYNWPAIKPPTESTIKKPDELIRLEPNLRTS
jgi:hypothetical protein